MNYKKLWIIILIIVIMGGLFPSMLIAKADEGENGGLPGREYSFQDAPFPGNYGNINQTTWEDFINRAETLGHTIIKKLVAYTLYYEKSSSETIWVSNPIFYSTDGTDVEDELDTINYSDFQIVEYTIKYIDTEKINVLNFNGHNISNKIILGHSASRFVLEGDYVVNANYASDIWYRADLVEDPYQNMPPMYNADPSRGYGMYFVKPSWGEWINIPHKLGTYRDYIEIELQVPRLYVHDDWSTDELFERLGDEQFVRPNLGIQLYSSNVKKIHGTNVPGRNGIWILPNDIKFVEGYMDGSYMYAAKFRAKIPIDHAQPADGGGSTITAMLYIYKSNNSEDILDYNWRLPEYDTWVKYLTYLGTVDADGDGFDDRTGLPVGQQKPIETEKSDKPNRDDYEDNLIGTISFYFDSFIWYIKQPFVFIGDLIGNILDWISTTIDSWIDGFTSIFTRLFSFLPAEVILMLALGFATMMIITIIRAIRGS